MLHIGAWELEKLGELPQGGWMGNIFCNLKIEILWCFGVFTAESFICVVLKGKFAIKSLLYSTSAIAVSNCQPVPWGQQGTGWCSVSTVKCSYGIFVTVCASV